MIDTIRFKVLGSEEIYNAIKNKGIERVMWDYVENTQKHVLVYQLIPIPQRQYKIYIKAQDTYSFFLEFSLPKVLFDTNVFMVYPPQVRNILFKVYKLVRDFLKTEIDSFDNWIVQRVDYCYVWKFENQYSALWLLQNLSKYQYPRKGITIRDTSLQIDGTTERMIFYLKHNEFKDVTFRKLYASQPLLADYLLEQSRGCLRFEIVQKKSKLMSLYGKEVTYKEIITDENINNTLNSALKTFCNSNNLISMSWQKATEIIYKSCNKREAFNLLGFMNVYYHNDLAIRELNRQFLKDNVSPSTIYKNKQKLKDLGIGILFTNPEYESIDLSIPSNNVINKEEQVAEIAAAIRELIIL